MLLPPAHVNLEEIRHAVVAQYGPLPGPLEFQPLGEDSWAFRSGDFWISVRRDLRGHVPGAYEAAAQLRRSGLRYVLAPLAGADGRVVRTVAGSPLVVFPWVEAVQLSRESVTGMELDDIVDKIRRIHSARVDVELPIDAFHLDFTPDLVAALHFVDGPAPREPGLALRLHELLAVHRNLLDRLHAEWVELAGRCAADDTAPVLTHGEPSAPNVLRARDGFLLADWGGAMWGPPERDWFHVRRTFGWAPAGRPAFMRLYEVRWILSEITEYATLFRASPPESQETQAMWQRLTRYLPEGRPSRNP